MKTVPQEASIRRAKLQDAAVLKRCIGRAYAPAMARLKDLPDVSGGLEQEIEDNIVLVAETEGGISGCVILQIENVSARLLNVAVDPDFRGLGLGRKLIEAAVEHARSSGAAEICLVTHAGMPENVSLYRHLGWSETSRNGNKILMKRYL